MAEQPFLPLFVGDFLGATVTWEGEERALYMLMLAYQWSGGALPANLEKLSRMLAYPHDKFLSLWETVRPKFVNRSGKLVNVRLEYHRERTIELSNARSVAGSVGGRASAAKRIAQAQAKREAPDQATDQATVEAIVEYCLVNTQAKSQANGQATGKQNSSILSDPILSDPIHHTHTGAAPDSNGQNGGPGRGSGVVDSAPFEREILALFPVGKNPPNWITALHAARELVDAGLATWPELVDVTRRYAAYMAAGGQSVNVAAHNFFDRRKGNYWQQPWAIPTNGKTPYVPPKSVKDLEDEAIARGIAEGRTDIDIAADIDVPIERVKALREVSHANR